MGIVDKGLLIRRLNLVAGHVVEESAVSQETTYEQLDLFTDYTAVQAKREKEDAELERERRRQQAVLEIKKRFGKNAVLKAASFEEGATAKGRDAQIGGHKAK